MVEIQNEPSDIPDIVQLQTLCAKKVCNRETEKKQNGKPKMQCGQCLAIERQRRRE
jgi:hypothetical protein